MNKCDACDTPLADPRMALCYPCADAEWDRWLDRNDDIGGDW